MFKIYFTPTISDQAKYLLIELVDESTSPDEETGSLCYNNGFKLPFKFLGIRISNKLILFAICIFNADNGTSLKSSGRDGCNTKNGECVPLCSGLTQEELDNGVQCKEGT